MSSTRCPLRKCSRHCGQNGVRLRPASNTLPPLRARGKKVRRENPTDISANPFLGETDKGPATPARSKFSRFRIANQFLIAHDTLFARKAWNLSSRRELHADAISLFQTFS